MLKFIWSLLVCFVFLLAVVCLVGWLVGYDMSLVAVVLLLLLVVACLLFCILCCWLVVLDCYCWLFLLLVGVTVIVVIAGCCYCWFLLLLVSVIVGCSWLLVDGCLSAWLLVVYVCWLLPFVGVIGVFVIVVASCYCCSYVCW